MSRLTDRAYRDDVERSLPAGEQLLFLEVVQRTALPLDLDLERAATGDTRPHPRRQRWIRGFDPFSGGLDVNVDRQILALQGSSGHGAPGTIGHDLWHLLDDPRGPRPAGLPARSGHVLLLAVTPARMLVLRAPKALTDQPVTVLYEVPRSRVASARRSRRPLAGLGVVEVSFTDGSMKAVQLGILWAGAARRLVRLLAA